MEIVEHLEIEKTSLATFNSVAEMFQFAKDHVCRHRNKEYLRSFASMLTALNSPLNEHWFLREYLWVVYVSGFSAERISEKYNDLLRAHNIETVLNDYIPISYENLLGETQREPIFKVFKNRKKAEAIQETRKLIFSLGWKYFYDYYLKERDPVKLDLLPNIGPALACHLARNLGNANVCKPDVHLNRLAKRYGFDSAADLCRGCSDNPIGQTDLILWFASKDHGTT